MTRPQLDTVTRFLRDLMAFTGRTKPTRNPPTLGTDELMLAEHRECVRWGGPATACPSDRYPWAEIIAGLTPPPPPPVPEEMTWQDAMWSAVAVAQHFRTGTKPHPLDMDRVIHLAEVMRRK